MHLGLVCEYGKVSEALDDVGRHGDGVLYLVVSLLIDSCEVYRSVELKYMVNYVESSPVSTKRVSMPPLTPKRMSVFNRSPIMSVRDLSRL